MRRFVIAGVLTAATPAPAAAHMVWLERDRAGPARAYFGEPGAGVREKAGRSETAAALDLELTPAAPEADEFVLLFRGAPLPRTALTAIAPPRWEKTLRTDEAGRVRLALPWAERYVVETAHVEEKPGGAGEAAYDRTRHVATLSFVVSSGIPSNDK